MDSLNPGQADPGRKENVPRLEIVFPFAHYSECGGVILLRLQAMLLQLLAHLWQMQAQEGVGLQFKAHIAGQADAVVFPQADNLLQALADVLVVRLDRSSKLKIASGVLMRAVDQGCRRQLGQTQQRGGHLLRGAFKHAATAGGKQSVATEHKARLAGMVISHMAQGVPWNMHNLQLMPQYADRLPVNSGQIAVADVFTGRSNHSGAGCLLDLLDAASMIAVVVGNQNVAQLPVGIVLQPLKYRPGITWIDHGATFAFRILQQPDIVIVKSGQWC